MKHTLLLTALLLAWLAARGEPWRMEDVSQIPAGQFFRLECDAGKYLSRDIHGRLSRLLSELANASDAKCLCGVRGLREASWFGRLT